MRSKQSPIIMSLTSLTLLTSMFTGPLSGIARSNPSGLAKRERAEQKAKVNHPALSRYAVDLTRLARQKRLEAHANHRAAVDRVVKILSGDAQHNPVLIGAAGEGNATYVAEGGFGLARRIVTNNVPASLQEKQGFSVN